MNEGRRVEDRFPHFTRDLSSVHIDNHTMLVAVKLPCRSGWYRMETQHLAPAWSTTLQMPINAWRGRPPRPAPFLTGWTWTTPTRPVPALVTPLYDVIICLSAVYFIPLIRAGFQSKGLTLESRGFNVSHCTCVSIEQSTASCVSHPLREKDLKHVRAHKNP